MAGRLGRASRRVGGWATGALGRYAVSVLAALVAVAILPGVAHACPVCFSASDENRQAFLVTTAFLSLLPLGMVAGAGLWLKRRADEVDGEDFDSHSSETD